MKVTLTETPKTKTDRFLQRLIKVPLEELAKPQDGYIVIMDNWWALDDEGRAILYRSGAWDVAPQCNSNRTVCEYLSKRMYSGAVKFVHIAYVPQRVQ